MRKFSKTAVHVSSRACPVKNKIEPVNSCDEEVTKTLFVPVDNHDEFRRHV